MEIIQPRWAAWTFLLYAGSFTILGAAFGWLSYFSATSGNAGYAAWAFVVFAVLVAKAEWFKRTGHRITAGLFAFAAVAVFVALVAALWAWFGWLSYGASGFSGFQLSRLLALALWVAATLIALRRFRFPFLVAQFALASWLLVTDLISGGGSWSAVVSLFVGFGFLAAGLGLDLGSTRPYGFWLHVAAGLLIGGSLIYLLHHGTFEWTLIAIASVVYIGLAQLFGRSSWAVLGALGVLLAAGEFTLEWTHIRVSLQPEGAGGRGWVPPLVFGLAGALLVALGLLAARRRAQPAAD